MEQLNPLIKVEENFIELIEKHDQLLYADTDSVIGTTELFINDKKIKIQDFFNEPGVLIKDEVDNKVKQFDNIYLTLSINKDKKLENKKIIYCMKHTVKKRFFNIKVKDKIVTVTEDHSIIVFREGCLCEIKPSEVKANDRLFKILRKT